MKCGKKCFAQFWRRMTEMFGKRWTDQYGRGIEVYGDDIHILNNAWFAEISRLDVEALTTAVDALMRSGDEFPPSLPTFLVLARRKTKPEHAEYHALPKPVVSAEALQKYRERLGDQAKSLGSGGRRCAKYKHESFEDWQKAKAQHIAAGGSEVDFLWERLRANGWTRQEEVSLARSSRLNNYDLYSQRKKNKGVMLVTEEEIFTGVAITEDKAA